MPAPAQVKAKLADLIDEVWDRVKAGDPLPDCSRLWNGTIGSTFLKIHVYLSPDEATIWLRVVNKSGSGTWR